MMKLMSETICVLVFLSTLCIGNGMLNMTLFTDPPGPLFSAATWIRFACKVHTHSAPETLTYQWIGICHETSEVIFTVDDPLLDENGYAVIWLQSTPDFCQDYLECRATDMEGNGGLIEAMIGNVTGAGISIPTKAFSTLPNNSAIIVDSETVRVVCHSASKTICSGQWITPNGNNVAQTNCGSLTFSFVDLLVETSTKTEGVYTCIIPDENGVAQTLHIGLYESSFLENVQTSIASMEIIVENDILTLQCLTAGLPPTATLWSMNGIRFDLYSNVTYDKSQELIDKTLFLYSSELSIPTSLHDEVGSLFSCDIFSDWTYANEPKAGRSYVTGHFVVIELGDVPVLPCKFPNGINSVEWMAGDDIIASSSGSNTATLVLNPTDVMDNVEYVCRGTTDNGFLEQHFMLLVYVPENTIVIELSVNDYEANKTVGEPYYVQCCSSALVNIPGMSCNPVLNWYYPDGSLATMGSQSKKTENETCATLIITELTIFHAGNYTCKAHIDHAFLDQPLSENVTYTLEVEGNAIEIEGGRHLLITIIAPIISAILLLAVIALLGLVLFVMQARLKKASQLAGKNTSVIIN